MKNELKILGLSFLLIFSFQSYFVWLTSNYFDRGPWIQEIQYVDQGDPRSTSIEGAYAHPGTTIVSLGVLFHRLLGTSYDASFNLAMSFLVAVIGAFITVVTFRLDQGSVWWRYVFLVTIFNRMYLRITPPSILASLLLTLFVLLTLSIVTTQKKLIRSYVIWGAVAGLACSSRFDISALIFGSVCLVLILKKLWKMILIGGLTAGIVLVCTDPFFWSMPPLQHFFELFYKIIWLHGGFLAAVTNPTDWIETYLWSSISMLFALFLLIRGRLPRLVNNPVLAGVAFSMVLAIAPVVTSRYVHFRYLVPFAFLLEVLFPFLLASSIHVNREVGSKKEREVLAVFGILWIIWFIYPLLFGSGVPFMRDLFHF